MSLNLWWVTDPEQRFWMEITHRPDKDIGTNLWCPSGDGVWANQLAEYVRPRDRVLHWKAWEPGREPSLVGWSEATSRPVIYHSDYFGDGEEISTWRVRLDGLKQFKRPVAASSLLPLIDEIMEVRDRLEDSYGKPVYFPFIRYGEHGLRARQGYLAKFPCGLFDVVNGISSARR